MTSEVAMLFDRHIDMVDPSTISVHHLPSFTVQNLLNPSDGKLTPNAGPVTASQERTLSSSTVAMQFLSLPQDIATGNSCNLSNIFGTMMMMPFSDHHYHHHQQQPHQQQQQQPSIQPEHSTYGLQSLYYGYGGGNTTASMTTSSPSSIDAGFYSSPPGDGRLVLTSNPEDIGGYTSVYKSIMSPTTAPGVDVAAEGLSFQTSTFADYVSRPRCSLETSTMIESSSACVGGLIGNSGRNAVGFPSSSAAGSRNCSPSFDRGTSIDVGRNTASTYLDSSSIDHGLVAPVGNYITPRDDLFDPATRCYQPSMTSSNFVGGPFETEHLSHKQRQATEDSGRPIGSILTPLPTTSSSLTSLSYRNGDIGERLPVKSETPLSVVVDERRDVNIVSTATRSSSSNWIETDEKVAGGSRQEVDRSVTMSYISTCDDDVGSSDNGKSNALACGWYPVSGQMDSSITSYLYI